MKNLFYFILPLIAVAVYADDYYFVGGGTPTTGHPSGAWSHFVDGTLVPVDRQPLQGEDNLVFNSDYIKSNMGQHQSQWILMKDAALDKDPQSIIFKVFIAVG